MDHVAEPSGRSESGEPQEPQPPDPWTATNLADLVGLLEQLREWAGRPSYSRIEQRARKLVGPGALPRASVHRVLSGRQDLAFVREPKRFVSDLVTTLGANPEPWLAVLNTLLSAPESESTAPATRPTWRRALRSRKVVVVAAVLILTVTGFVTWGVLAQETPPPPIRVNYTQPAVIESGDTGLRLAIAQNSAEVGARAALLDAVNARPASWDFAAPYRDNPDYYQLRPTGSLLMCLEVAGESVADRAPVQQWGCNGEQNQYWKVVSTPPGRAHFVNLNSGQCLSVTGSNPDAGMQLVQRECDERQLGQQWRITAVDRPRPSSPSTSASVVAPVVGPDPAEFPGGGKDQPCGGISPVLDAATSPWSNQPVLVRNEDATRGKVALGPESAGAVELMRANVRNGAGVEETFYWAEGFVKFTPKQFTMALQWTTVPGPGGWHTCAVPFNTEHGRPQTVALPRDSNHDGTRDVWFRICMSYRPSIRRSRWSTAPVGTDASNRASGPAWLLRR